MLDTGSPTYWNSMKAMKATASITTKAWASRRRMKASMRGCGKAGMQQGELSANAGATWWIQHSTFDRADLQLRPQGPNCDHPQFTCRVPRGKT
jgi:hypothetical protein